MPITRRKRYPNSVARRKVSGVGAEARLARRTPITPNMTAGTTSTATVEFGQPIILSGIPQYLSSNSTLPVSVSLLTTTSITLVYPLGSAIVSVSIPFEDPAVRNNAGGYVIPGIYAPEE